MKTVKRFFVILVWKISLWCLERIFIMLDWIEPMVEEFLGGQESNYRTE